MISPQIDREQNFGKHNIPVLVRQVELKPESFLEKHREIFDGLDFDWRDKLGLATPSDGLAPAANRIEEQPPKEVDTDGPVAIETQTRTGNDFTHSPDYRSVSSEAKRERNPWVSARRTELRNMMRQGQEPSALEVCKRWDLEGIRVPSGWAMDKLTATWVGAYNNRKLRGRVQKLISTEMRNIRRPA